MPIAIIELVVLGSIALGLFGGAVVLFAAMARMRSGGDVAAEERVPTALGHLAGYGGYLIPLGGALIPLVVMIAARDGGPVESAAKQALALNVFVFLTTILLLVLWFTVVLIPLAWGIAAALALVALVVPAIGAIQALSGSLSVYPFVGGMATGQ